jgi:DNA-binding transcriptional regulator GbsR (MarR family)
MSEASASQTTPDPDGDLRTHDPLFDELVDGMGRFFEGFGFRKHLGRVWMTLYLSEDPMTQSDLQGELGLSAGMVSTVLKDLSGWGAIRTRTLPASRQTWYRAETDLLAYVVNILKRRDLPQVQDLDRLVQHAVDEFERRDDIESRRLARRLRPIRQLASLYEAMTSLVVRLAEGPQDSIRKGLKLVRNIRAEF